MGQLGTSLYHNCHVPNCPHFFYIYCQRNYTYKLYESTYLDSDSKEYFYIYRAKPVNVEFHISVLRYHWRYFCSLFIIELT